MPENCGFTSQHDTPNEAQLTGASPAFGLGMPNGGLQVVNPSNDIYQLILEQLSKPETMQYDFADQSLLGDVFFGRWVALPYTYNALKTLRWKGVHHQIWRDDQVKNVHYILSPKPWDEKAGEATEESHKWWWASNQARLDDEKARGIDDGF